MICPRCAVNEFTPYGETNVHPYPAISRMDDATLICHECGECEAVRERLNMAPIGPSEWPCGA